jgi:membrane glycosyltransferase
MSHADTERDPPTDTSQAHSRSRRTAFLAALLFISGTGNLLFADFLWRTGLYGLKYGLMALHLILFTLISYVFCTALFGFLSVRLRWLSDSTIPDATASTASLPPTAIVFPIHDEDVASVAARVEATWQSLQRTGHHTAFHLYLLSDSLNPKRWIEEEIAWFQVARRLHAIDNIHYRHRPCNDGLKAGNLADFLEHWGQNYRYMIVFDADSLMSGERMVDLVRRMEAQPRVGILQTVTGAICAQTLYARIQQFGSRLYSRLFMAGMDFWQNGDANYFGHNAIVRVEPFMANCRLPHLPWREPLGGQIYSHDFVEAALMRRAGWEVRTTHETDGSYEQPPANMLESVQRHRRWCQGNLQHAWLLFSRDLPLASRCHFLLGILAYLSSLLWLIFLIFSTLVVLQFERTGLSLIATSGFTPFNDMSLTAHGAVLFILVLFLLFAPKFLSLIDLLCEPARLHQFGGAWRTTASLLIESLFSIVAAPLFMLWHSLFVLTLPFGKGVAWKTQNRSPGQPISWRAATRAYGWMTLVGLCWALLALTTNARFASWMLPVLLPLALSIPINRLFSSAACGDQLRGAGLLLTPEETSPPQELTDCTEAEYRLHASLQCLDEKATTHALADPYVNALHAELQSQPYAAAFRVNTPGGQFIDPLLHKGLDALSREQLIDFLRDGSACRRAHLRIWHTPDTKIAPEWRAAIAAYGPDRNPPMLSGT